jgi:hypothetical protein
MDYQEFEQHVADYVEGTLDDELRARMDAARRADPACEQLARVHEQILTTFEETPEVQAPGGLSERIFAQARVREQLVAAEQKAFRRGIWLGVIGAAIGAAALVVMIFVMDMRTGAATLENATSAGTNWLTQAAATLYGWLDAAGAAMDYNVTLPVIGRTVPIYVLVVCGMFTAILAWFRDEIMAALDSF